jgi:hypothetical protein
MLAMSDSLPLALPLKDYACNEIRYRSLAQSRPAEAVLSAAAGRR